MVVCNGGSRGEFTWASAAPVVFVAYWFNSTSPAGFPKSCRDGFFYDLKPCRGFGDLGVAGY